METARPSKILIIEDNSIDREVYKRCLWESTTWGFEFAEADSATLGMEMAAQWRPDCVLVDVNLPDIDGIEALASVKAKTGQMPFAAVVLTSYSEEAVAVRAMKAGAMDYLPKGKVTADTFPHIVRNAIERFLMQRRIEEQRSLLESSAQRYQVLLEAIPQMVWTANADGVLEYANRQLLEYTGLKVGGIWLDWVRLVYPDDRERTEQAWRQAKESASVFEVEHRMRRAKDGSFRWHLVRAIPMKGHDNEVIQWFGTCTEIESQKRLGEENLENQKLESLGRLAGGLAHDLNNLLVVILGGADCAINKLPSSHPAQETLDSVMQAGESAADLVRKMVAYAGKGNLCVARTQVDTLAREAIEAAAVPKNISIELQAGRKVPVVEVDPQLLRQAITDLVKNSAEAIGEAAAGSITVRISAVDLGPQGARRGFRPVGMTPGRYVSVEVRDTGCGMDEETRTKVFDPFFTTKFLGRGLGLAAVQGFARSNGGGVQVESSPGKGARFRLLLPAAADQTRGAVT